MQSESSTTVILPKHFQTKHNFTPITFSSSLADILLYDGGQKNGGKLLYRGVKVNSHSHSRLWPQIFESRIFLPQRARLFSSSIRRWGWHVTNSYNPFFFSATSFLKVEFLLQTSSPPSLNSSMSLFSSNDLLHLLSMLCKHSTFFVNTPLQWEWEGEEGRRRRKKTS